MEENVALESSKQKQFVKSIKGIKKLIKRTANDPENVEPKSKKDKKTKKYRPKRGLVYLSHIPHGFYEHEMTQYFKQFGGVSNVRVIRSKRTGNSRGFAFVEFKQPAVAEIVAETMNNYLMGKRLLKAAYIPPEKQKRAMRKHWSRLNNPGRTERLKQNKAYNTDKDEVAELKKAKKTLSNFNKNMKKLSELGINYDFFTPVDIPEGLSVQINDSQKIDNENRSKKETLTKDSKKKDKNVKEETKKPVQESKVDTKKEKKKPEPVMNKEQNKKQQKLKDAGVKLPENFIKINDESENSDSSDGFDSDNFREALENDSDADSGEDSESGDDESESGDEEIDDDDDESGPGESDEFEITGSDDDESDGDDESDEEILPPLKKSKGKGPIIPQPVQTKKQANKPQKSTKAPEQKGPKGPVHQKGPKGPLQKNGSEQIKRKAPQKNEVSPKKPKFEKQTQQPMKKQFKKKK